MARNVFISFLGAGKYIPCRYYFEDNKNKDQPKESFVQAFLIDSLKDTLGKEDAAYFFLTDLAKERNWRNDGHTDSKTEQTIPGMGLQSKLAELKQKGVLKANVYVVEKVPEGFSSEQLWKIFSLINSVLRNDDQVYLDVTHAFRHIPMLVLSAMMYEKANKDITLKAIFYGVFEHHDPENKPVLNLLSIEQLQQWSIATYDFEKNGSTTLLSDLTLKEINPILANSKGQDQHSAQLKKLITGLQRITNNINTNRGKEIEKYASISETIHTISELKDGTFIKPIEALFEKIRNKIQQLQLPEDFPAWLKSSAWCLKHKLIQQGITQLNEGIVTYVIEAVKLELNYSVFNISNRYVVAQCFKAISTKESLGKLELEYSKEVISAITGLPSFKEFAQVFQNLNDNYRNDINHAGYRPHARKPVEFETILRECINDLENMFRVKIIFNNLPQKCLKKFINISNHPASKWRSDQMNAALEYGEIEDFAFPQISPEHDDAAIEILAQNYFLQIINENQPYQLTIHLMGEQTFCYALLQKFKAVGIKVVASTTSRISEDETGGKKTSVFQFVRFREY